MTIRVRVARAECPSKYVLAEGASLPHAVRVAVRKLGLGPGRTVRRWEDSPFSGSWHWDWSGTLLQVVQLDKRVESNCGAGGASLCDFHPGVCDACRRITLDQRKRGVREHAAAAKLDDPRWFNILLSHAAIDEMARGAAERKSSLAEYLEFLLGQAAAARGDADQAVVKERLEAMLAPYPCRCGAKPGRFHKSGCDVERCVLCGGQAIACDCAYVVNGMDPADLEEQHPRIYKNGPTKAMLDKLADEEDKCGGRLAWAGFYPGTAECVEFGWFSRWADRATGQPADFASAFDRPGQCHWVSCSVHDEGAGPDLNRLNAEAVWDRKARRFVMRS